ncbi:TetR/AcrR family transcriptional regulator [Okibacterium endophyticum]
MVLRADARENRDRIVDAAEALFAQEGLGAPMSEIARRAGVGAATLSRRFPTRDSLIDAVFERQLTWWMDAINAVQKAPDGWAALSELLERACVEQARDQVCADLVVRAFFHGTRFDAEKSLLESAVEQILAAAKRAGEVRADVGWMDIVLLIEANAGAANLATSDPEASARRLVRHFLRSFSAS